MIYQPIYRLAFMITHEMGILRFRKKKLIHIPRFIASGCLFCCLFVSLCSWSQSLPLSSHASLAEKIYLQLDDRIYATGQTIWFKAIVLNAGDHTPGKRSGVLYAELIDPNENIVEKKLIKIEESIGEGFFQLPPNYNSGFYQVRAYTEWNKNFGHDFFFREYILVSEGEGKMETNPITNLTIVEGQGGSRKLQVNFSPLAIDTFSAKSITVVLTLDEKKDTIQIRKSKSNEYLLNYEVPENSRVVTVQAEGNNHVNYSRTIALDTGYLDLQFLPESGELVQGLPGVLGVKALGYNGRGRQLDGQIVNSKGKLIAAFKTNELGMAMVKIEKVDSSDQYRAKLISPAAQRTFLLPAVAAKGNILSVRREGVNIRLIALSNYLTEDSILVRASCRGAIYFDFKGQLRNGNLEFSLPANTLPEGIIDFTLMTNLGMPVAERLYFNQRPDTRIGITAFSEKQQYVQRENTQLTIETKNGEGQPVPAHVSVLVFNKSQQGSLLDSRQNILSYFLLSSDLKGEIENPVFYFTKGADRFNDMDALLLTQGWRKYNYKRDPLQIRFAPEPSLVVSGVAKGGLSDNKIIPNADLTMMTFGKNSSVEKQKTDSSGRFLFPLNDEYGDDLRILIQSVGKANKQKDYLITLDKKESPAVLFNHVYSIEKPDSIVKEYIKKTLTQIKVENDYRKATEGMLEEVIVRTRILSPQQKEVTEKYGKPKMIISGKDIQAKEEKWSYGLYSVLLFNFSDKIIIMRSGNGLLYAAHKNNLLTLVVVDGIAVKAYEYGLIPKIQPSEVKSFEIIEYSTNFRSLYCEFYPPGCRDAHPFRNVIAIYTHAGKGLLGINPTVGISKMTVPVFSPTREFYAPRYQQLKPDDWKKPDVRSLLHWAPKLKTDTTGRSSVSFYNSDNTGEIQVVVEAIAESGEIGYQELFYEVKKRE